MAGTGAFGLPRQPRTDTRVRRFMQKLSGAPGELLYGTAIERDSRGRLAVDVDNTELILASQVFSRR